jgi:hypothetical protein
MEAGDLSPDGKLRLRDPVELGWDLVGKEIGKLAIGENKIMDDEWPTQPEPHEVLPYYIIHPEKEDHE